MKAKKSLFYLLAVVIAGCVPSLHPLYTNKDVVFEEKLLGVWSENSNNIWEFKKSSEPNAYDLCVVMNNDKDDGKKSNFKAHLVKIDDMLFLDMFPAGEPNMQEGTFYKCHLLPVHTFVRVDQIQPALTIAFMDYDKFEKKVEADPNLIKHEIVENRVVLTASTQELQNFMRKHAKDEGVFGKPMELKRIEPNVPAEPNTNNKAGN